MSKEEDYGSISIEENQKPVVKEVKGSESLFYNVPVSEEKKLKKVTIHNRELDLVKREKEVKEMQDHLQKKIQELSERGVALSRSLGAANFPKWYPIIELNISLVGGSPIKRTMLWIYLIGYFAYLLLLVYNIVCSFLAVVSSGAYVTLFDKFKYVIAAVLTFLSGIPINFCLFYIVYYACRVRNQFAYLVAYLSVFIQFVFCIFECIGFPDYGSTGFYISFYLIRIWCFIPLLICALCWLGFALFFLIFLVGLVVVSRNDLIGEPPMGVIENSSDQVDDVNTGLLK